MGCKPHDLDYYIKKSGMKIGSICEKLGISRQSFLNKRKGATNFTVCEMKVLADMLAIPDEERASVFSLL